MADGATTLEGAAQAYSGARLERVVFGDGRRLVLKHLPAAGDWLTRATDGQGRVRRLWESGLLDRVGEVVDHAVVGIVDARDHDVVVMRDVGDRLLETDGELTRATCRDLLAGLARFHAALALTPDDDPAGTAGGLCELGARYGLFAPSRLAADAGPSPHPLAGLLLSGWQRFADSVPPEVNEAVAAVHRDPGLLGRPLGERGATLLHGDAKPDNLGTGPHGLVAVDWGELTGYGPREVDLAWFALQASWRTSFDPGLLFADYESLAAAPLDRAALDLACIGSVAQLGCRIAAVASAPDHPAAGRGRLLLDWWVARVRDALDRTGLG